MVINTSKKRKKPTFLIPFAKLGATTQRQFASSFLRMAGVNATEALRLATRAAAAIAPPPPAAQGGAAEGKPPTPKPVTPPPKTTTLAAQIPDDVVLRYESLPSMLAILNIATSLHDVEEDARMFSVQALIAKEAAEEKAKQEGGWRPPIPEKKMRVRGENEDDEEEEDDDDDEDDEEEKKAKEERALGLFLDQGGAEQSFLLCPLDDLRFHFRGIVQLYDHLVPRENLRILQWLAFFDLLDEGGTGTLRLSELRHALCRLGDHPLTDAEYNHMLYRRRLLHKTTVTVFEFMRLIMDVPTDDVCDAVSGAAL